MKLRRKLKKKRTCTYADHPTWYGKTWHFLWHEDTWLSFLADAILIVLIGNFIIYPGVGLLMGTDLPAVAVVSGSMDHNDKSFGTWWANNENHYAPFNISKSEFNDFQLKNGFNKGDVLFVVGDDDYDVGDIIVYSVSSRAYPIIHRVVAKDFTTYNTKGDANSAQIGFEKSVSSDQIHGKAVFRLPYLGWPKVLLMELFS